MLARRPCRAAGLPFLLLCFAGALGERVTDWLKVERLRSELELGSRALQKGAEELAVHDGEAQAQQEEGVIFGVVPGLAFMCRESCTESLDQMMMSSPVLDAMDYSDVKVVFVLDPCPNKVCRVTACKETITTAEYGYDDDDLRLSLNQAECTMVDMEVEQNRLMNLPEDDLEGKPILKFQDTPVRDFMEFIRTVNKLAVYSPSYLSKITGDTEERQLAALAQTFSTVLVWYYAGLKGARETARIRLWVLEQERLSTIGMKLAPGGGRAPGKSKPGLGGDAIVRRAREHAVSQIAAEVRAIEELVAAEFLRVPALAGNCEAQRLTAEVRGLRADLDKLTKDQREADKSARKDIAVASFEAAFAGLCVAADLGVPGIGTALNAVRVALQQVIAYAATFMQPSVLQAIQGGQSVLASIESPPGGAGTRLGLFGATVAGNAWVGAVEAAPEAIVEDSVKLDGTIAQMAPVALAKARAVMKTILVAGATEGAWTAPQFIPVVGPFVALGRGLATLSDVASSAYSSKQEYYKAKDPLLRSLFRMRDCNLDTVRNLGAVGLAADRNVDVDTRVGALMSAIDAAQAAAAINEDLISRVFKQVWYLQTAKSHESKVMTRLRTGATTIYGKVPVNTTNGDNYLSDDVLSPSAWQARFGNAIRQAYPKILKVAEKLPHSS